MRRGFVSLLVAFLCCAADWSPTQSIGFYSAGCLQGAQPLPLDGPGYEAIRISRNRYWGQPVMLEYIQVLAAKIKAAGQAQLYIGDIGQPRGGPAPTGHASRQVGLDADIWFERQPGARRAPADRENPRLRSLVRADDGGIDDTVFSQAHVSLLRSAAEMPHIDRIFVNKWIKQRLCQTVTCGSVTTSTSMSGSIARPAIRSASRRPATMPTTAAASRSTSGSPAHPSSCRRPTHRRCPTGRGCRRPAPRCSRRHEGRHPRSPARGR